MVTIYRAVHYPKFGEWDSFNIDQDAQNILFHYSVRPPQKLIVVNELLQGVWGEERHLPFSPEAAWPVIIDTVLSETAAQLLVGGQLLLTLPLARQAGAVAIRASMPWSRLAPPAGQGRAWLPAEGIGAAELRGFIAAPGWEGGEASLTIGERDFALAAEATSGPLALRGFHIELPAEARQALLIARSGRRPARLAVAFPGLPPAEAWLNPPGVVEQVEADAAAGWVAGWVAAGGAPPRLELVAGGRRQPLAATLGEPPAFPPDSRIAAATADEDTPTPLRRMRFRAPLPSLPWAEAGPDGLLELVVTADGTELTGGRFALAAAAAEATAPEATASEAPEPPAPPARFEPAAATGPVEVLRLDVPAEASKDIFIDLVAGEGEIPLHLRFRAPENRLVVNRCANGKWGREKVLAELPASRGRLLVDAEIGAGSCVIAINHRPWAVLEDLGLAALEARGPHRRFARAAPRGPAQPAATVPPLGAAITAVESFTLRGQAPLPAPPLLELRVAGRVVPAPVIQWQEAGRQHFEVELPGTVWQAVPPGAPVPLELLLDGQPIEPAGLLLTRAMARRALERVARNGIEGRANQLAALHALEHLAFGRFLEELAPEPAETLRGIARRLNLEPFLLRESAPTEAAPPPAPPAPGKAALDRIAVWRALRDVNRRMARDDQKLFGLASNVARDWGLTGERLGYFWFALVPNLAATDELPRLDEALPFATWFHHEGSSEAWALSSVVALLAAAGEAKRAGDALYRLASHTTGWINTGCIGFALREMERRAARRLLPEGEAERFRYAFLGLLDAFKGEWFSRLHDRHLMEGMVTLLGRKRLMSDYLADDVARAALRHYGLSPAFWAELRRRPPATPDPLLALAARHFAALAEASADPVRADRELAGIHVALDFFRAQRNPEAAMWLREVAAHALRFGGAAAPADVARLLSTLVARDARDAVRIAAFPGRAPPGGIEALGLPGEAITNLLREMRPQPRSQTAATQREACRLLLASGAARLDDAALEALLALADALDGARGGHLGTDLLAMIAARRGGRVADAVVSRLEADLARLLAEGPAHLPAPVLAGLARLGRLSAARGDPFLAETLRGLRGLVAARYAALHDAALDPPEVPHEPIAEAALAGDVLVCVYSCNKYLDSRVAAIRATWMRDLAAVGARCVVVVGDGDDTLDGDVLRLDVSDAYEDLPLKTLRMVEWAHRHTAAQYIIKIDDDCQLSVPHFFGTLEYRAHHYHGRVIERPIGGTDRVWHHAKSSSERARGIDRSPEPSRYCDGGGVYALSRFAMGRLLEAARGREGQRLIACSFMEDKLLGDLLALGGIAPDNTGYESYQRRRSFGGAHPVGIYENTFFPSKLAPAKVVHLDLAEDQKRAEALRGREELHPKKLWPGFATVGTGWGDHQLEMLSGPRELAAAQAEPIGVVLAARNEMTMLPHFLAHYRGLGVRSFFVVDNNSDDGSREYLLAQPDVALYSATTEYRTSHYGVTWQQTLLGGHFLARWAVVADADEFLIYPGWREKPLAALVAEIEAEGADALPLPMVDMYPFGSLEDADFAALDPFEAAPWMDREAVRPYRLTACYYSNRIQQVSGLRHRLLPDSEPNGFVAEKVALFRYRPWVRVSEGIHSATNLRLSSRKAAFAHFKYHKGFRQKILDEIARGQHYNGAVEYKRYAAMIAESFGAFGREGESVQLSEDGFVQG